MNNNFINRRSKTRVHEKFTKEATTITLQSHIGKKSWPYRMSGL
jgi:hypothetical protein